MGHTLELWAVRVAEVEAELASPSLRPDDDDDTLAEALWQGWDAPAAQAAPVAQDGVAHVRPFDHMPNSSGNVAAPPADALDRRRVIPTPGRGVGSSWRTSGWRAPDSSGWRRGCRSGARGRARWPGPGGPFADIRPLATGAAGLTVTPTRAWRSRKEGGIRWPRTRAT